MSRNLTSWMLDHIKQPSTRLAVCIGIDLVDGSGRQYSFTDHDRPVKYLGRTYDPYAGAVSTAFSSTNNLSVDNMQVIGIVDSDSFTFEDLSSGRLNYADIHIFFTVYTDPDSAGVITLIKNKLGRVRRIDNQFIAEIRGIAQEYQQIIGEPYQVLCPVDFGSARCGLDTTQPAWLKNTSVTQIIGPRVFQTSLVDVDSFYREGFLKWTSGQNQWFRNDVKDSIQTDGVIELYEEPPFPITVGDTLDITGGCIKTEAACKEKNNYVNYQGFPHILGITRDQ